MAKKKIAKKNKVLTSKHKTKVKKSNVKSITSKKGKKLTDKSIEDSSFVIVDDNIVIDKEKEIEERRAYLEEARSQETADWDKSFINVSIDFTLSMNSLELYTFDISSKDLIFLIDSSVIPFLNYFLGRMKNLIS